MVDVPVVFVVQVYGLFWEMTSGTFPYLLGSTVDTYSASVFGCFWKNFIFSTFKDVPEVDSRPGAVRTGNLDIYSTSSSYDVADGFFRRILRHFSHSVRMDVSAHFSALDDEEFFVVEGSGWRGRRESDSQVFCHSN